MISIERRRVQCQLCNGGQNTPYLVRVFVSTAGFGGAPVEFGIDFGGVAIVRDTRQMVMMLATQIDGRAWSKMEM